MTLIFKLILIVKVISVNSDKDSLYYTLVKPVKVILIFKMMLTVKVIPVKKVIKKIIPQ